MTSRDDPRAQRFLAGPPVNGSEFAHQALIRRAAVSGGGSTPALNARRLTTRGLRRLLDVTIARVRLAQGRLPLFAQEGGIGVVVSLILLVNAIAFCGRVRLKRAYRPERIRSMIP